MEKQDYFKILACLSVFFIFFFIPVCVFRSMEMKVENMQTKENLNQLKMWAEVYRIKNRGYEGMENNYEVSTIVKTLNYMGKDCELILAHDSFCAKAKKTDEKTKMWCVDNTGYSGPEINNCDYDKEIRCK